VLVAGNTHRAGNPAQLDFVAATVDGFFAPDRIRALARRWGWSKLDQAYSDALNGFAETATRLDVRIASGMDDALMAYGQLLEGRSDPAVAHLVDLTGQKAA
jgi:hypothetical protein